MATFRVTVTATSTTTYSVEVEADNEQEAEKMATSSNVYAVASDSEFGISHGNCSFDAVAEQLTAECPSCYKVHPVPNDDLRLCYCGQFGHNPYAGTPGNPDGRARQRPHIIVDNICTPAPWWWDDPAYCPPCGATIEEEESQEVPRHVIQ